MFKFTIRELLLLTVIVAMGVGWWLERSSLIRELESLQFAADLRSQGPPPDLPETDPSKEPNAQE